MKDKKIIATMGLSNTGGIAIFSIIFGINDKVKFSYFTGDNYGRLTTSTIRTGEEGQPYFNSGRQKYYLNEFILTN